MEKNGQYERSNSERSNVAPSDNSKEKMGGVGGVLNEFRGIFHEMHMLVFKGRIFFG